MRRFVLVLLLSVISTLAAGVHRGEASPMLDFFAGGGGETWVGSGGLYIAPRDRVLVDSDELLTLAVVRLVFSAGPPEGVEDRADGGLVYHFSGATLSFYQDSRAVGLFAVLPFTFTLGPLSPVTQGLVDPFPELDQRPSRPSVQPVSLGLGVLDDAFAEALGVGRYTSGGEYSITLDNFSPVIPSECRPHLPAVPDPYFHCGVVNYAFGHIEAVDSSIPEPATLLLLTTGVGFVARHRARASRR